MTGRAAGAAHGPCTLSSHGVAIPSLLLVLLLRLALAGADEAVHLLRLERVSEAMAEAQRAVRADPGDVASHELIIDILYNFGLAGEAQAMYRAHLQGRERDPAAWALLGRASMSPEDSERAYDQALQLDGRYARAWMGLGAVARGQGQLAEAEKHYRMALSLDPTLSEAWSGLFATVYAESGPGPAWIVCEQAMKAVPEDPEAWLAAAAMRPEKAIEYLTEGARRVPDEPRLHAALGGALLAAGQVAEARASYERVLTLTPGAPQAQLDLELVRQLERGTIDLRGQAELARARGLAEEAPLAARDALDQLVAQYPSCYLVFLARGHLLTQQKQLGPAESDLRRALLLAPDSPDAQAALGLLLLSRNQPKEARVLLESAWARRPWDASLGIAVGMARLGTEGPALALRTLADVADRFPMDPRPVMAMVSVYTQIGDTAGAYAVLQEACSRRPDPGLLLALAAAAKDLGRTEEAAQALLQVERVTGDPRYGRLAAEARAAAPAGGP